MQFSTQVQYEKSKLFPEIETLNDFHIITMIAGEKDIGRTSTFLSLLWAFKWQNLQVNFLNLDRTKTVDYLVQKTPSPDFILVNCPPGYSEVALPYIKLASFNIVITSGGKVTSVCSAYDTIKLFIRALGEEVKFYNLMRSNLTAKQNIGLYEKLNNVACRNALSHIAYLGSIPNNNTLKTYLKESNPKASILKNILSPYFPIVKQLTN